jgi:hypothetical protein
LVGKELKLGMPGTNAALTHTILHTHTACFKSISKVHDQNATHMQQGDGSSRHSTKNLKPKYNMMGLQIAQIVQK